MICPVCKSQLPLSDERARTAAIIHVLAHLYDEVRGPGTQPSKMPGVRVK